MDSADFLDWVRRLCVKRIDADLPELLLYIDKLPNEDGRAKHRAVGLLHSLLNGYVAIRDGAMLQQRDAERARRCAPLPGESDIERAARAILQAQSPEASGWSGKPHEVKEHYRKLARAALETAVIDEEEPVRVDGDALCPDCSRKYGDHEPIPGWPTFHRGCDSTLLKL